LKKKIRFSPLETAYLEQFLERPKYIAPLDLNIRELGRPVFHANIRRSFFRGNKKIPRFFLAIYLHLRNARLVKIQFSILYKRQEKDRRHERVFGFDYERVAGGHPACDYCSWFNPVVGIHKHIKVSDCEIRFYPQFDVVPQSLSGIVLEFFREVNITSRGNIYKGNSPLVDFRV